MSIVSLVQVMVCREPGYYPNACSFIFNWTFTDKLQQDLNEDSMRKMYLKMTTTKYIDPMCCGGFMSYFLCVMALNIPFPRSEKVASKQQSAASAKANLYPLLVVLFTSSARERSFWSYLTVGIVGLQYALLDRLWRYDKNVNRWVWDTEPIREDCRLEHHL